MNFHDLSRAALSILIVGVVSLVSAPRGIAADPAQPKPKPTPNYVGQISSKLKPTRSVIYKKVADRELRLDLFNPKDFQPTDRRPCFVAIHGGGWTSGSPGSMYAFAQHATDLGLVAISVQYRLYKAGSEVTVFDCVKDARSTLRYIRAHAADFGIDPQKIVATGASAGGHLAAATALFDGVDEPGEDTTVSCAPNALVLFSPVIDTSPAGYGHAKIAPAGRNSPPPTKCAPTSHPPSSSTAPPTPPPPSKAPNFSTPP